MSAIDTYIHNISRRLATGICTEHSYRPDLQMLLEAVCGSECQVTNEPTRIECGAPDLIITRGEIPVGYVEAKDIGEPLQGAKHREQFERYLASLDNLIITDYLRFDFYVSGELIDSIELANLEAQSIVLNESVVKVFRAAVKNFSGRTSVTIRSIRRLATSMATKARLMAAILEQAIRQDKGEEATTDLVEQFEAFKSVLINDIGPGEFADIYAQTIAYGLFAARLHDSTLDNFSRSEAAALIPRSNPFLRKLFQYIAGYDLDPRISWIVEELVQVFRSTDVTAIQDAFRSTLKRHDPIIHLYETFLAEYDEATRRARGVWYTPEPVVDFITRAADCALREWFGLSDGLADASKINAKIQTDKPDARTKTGYRMIEREMHRVQILDPACGTGTFLADIVRKIRAKFEGLEGAWPTYVAKDLIPRLHGFELLMAPYAVAHLKLEMFIRDFGGELPEQERIRIFLTNSLEEHHPDTGTLFATWLSREAREADLVKRDTPVMVVIGNPPYASSSANKGQWISTLLEDYKKGLNEKKINIEDDYIKFVRYAQYLIEKSGNGLVAIITNNSYLDGITHRQMRKELVSKFNHIVVLDLGGDTRQGRANDSDRDDNVFDIQQGTAIALLARSEGRESSFRYARVTGTRTEKYEFLIENSLESILWEHLAPEAPNWFFFPTKESHKEYEQKFLSLTEIFDVYSSGIQTKRDALLVCWTREEAKQLLSDLKWLSEDQFRAKYKVDDGAWKLRNAMDDVRENPAVVVPFLYRPFDKRFIPYSAHSNGLLGRPRHAVMKHFLKANRGLIVNRQHVGRYSHVLITDCMACHGTNYLGNRGQDYVIPLFVYDSPASEDLISTSESRRVNLKDDALASFVTARDGATDLHLGTRETEKFGSKIMDYCFGLLNSDIYQDSFAEHLRKDFPRIPLPTSSECFDKIAELGSQLRHVHLEAKVNPLGRLVGVGSNRVDRKIAKSDVETYGNMLTIWINDSQKFEEIPLDVWSTELGGYQVACKWLNDKHGRTLSLSELRSYRELLAKISTTLEIKNTLNEVVTKHYKWARSV